MTDYFLFWRILTIIGNKVRFSKVFYYVNPVFLQRSLRRSPLDLRMSLPCHRRKASSGQFALRYRRVTHLRACLPQVGPVIQQDSTVLQLIKVTHSNLSYPFAHINWHSISNQPVRASFIIKNEIIRKALKSCIFSYRKRAQAIS